MVTGWRLLWTKKAMSNHFVLMNRMETVWKHLIYANNVGGQVCGGYVLP